MKGPTAFRHREVGQGGCHDPLATSAFSRALDKLLEHINPYRKPLSTIYEYNTFKEDNI